LRARGQRTRGSLHCAPLAYAAAALAHAPAVAFALRTRGG